MRFGTGKVRRLNRALGPVQTLLQSCAEPNWIRSDFGATLARQPIQTAYRVSILTFISCAEKEKSLGPIPYCSAVIDFLFVEDLSSCFCRPFFAGFIWIIIFDLFFVLFHYFSETWLTICDWTARFPAFNSFIILEDRARYTEVFLALYILYS